MSELPDAARRGGQSRRGAHSVRVATRYASSFIEVGMTTPAKQLAGFIAKFDPAIARLARSCRTVLRRRFPTAVELAYDNYNALAIGYASTERASDCIVSLAVFPRSVALSFYYGASLPDPTKILSGSGNQNRYISLDRPDRLKDPAVEALIKAAIANGKVSLPTSKGYLVIKSISAKQRPRRPSAVGARSRPR